MMALPPQDPTSLKNLHDVIVPDSVGFWPPAIGWYFLGGLVVAIGLMAGSLWILSWFNNRYRRAGLLELAQLRDASENGKNNAATIASLDCLLKRVALAAWPRPEVARLSGEAWMNFLNRTCRRQVFSPEQIRTFRDVGYSTTISEGISGQQMAGLFLTADRWIREHRLGEIADGGQT